MNHLAKIIFYVFIISVGLNITIKPVLSLTADPTFNTRYEYFEKLPTDSASLVVMITPQDLMGREIFGIEAYFQTEQYQLPLPFYSNFNINFQGWGLGDWVCEIGQEALRCQGKTALEVGKKTIVAMYFSDNITPPDYVVTKVLDLNSEVVVAMDVGSATSLSVEPEKPSEGEAAQPSTEALKSTNSVSSTEDNQKEIKFVSWSNLTGIAAALAIFSSAFFIIRHKKLPRRKRKKKNKPCPTCNSTGKIKIIREEEEIVKCPNCQNVPAKRCPHCGGTGKMSEAGQLAVPKTREALEIMPLCDWCRGTGWKGGAIKKMTPCYFTGAACTICKGRGYTIQKKQVEKLETCPTCKGRGVVPE